MSKNVTKTEEKPSQVAVISNELPAYLASKTKGARGMEDVTTNDVIIPRLEVVQSLSPARDKTSPLYITGSEEGMFYNNVTRELYGSEVLVVPVVYKKQWLIWKDRKVAGGGAGGFRGACNTELEAKQRILNELSEEQGLEVVETAQHFCYLLRGDGRMEEIVLSMAKSKLKVSKRWNSLMRIAEDDCFTRVYKVSAVVEQNAKGDKFQNVSIANAGYAPEAVYLKAEKLYAQISKGGVVVSNDYEGEASGQKDETEF